ncbi:MAG: hypothetical protein JEZ07_12420 [Phycisphaerae bacterium]|nr:hypothetical protein [Phycisphaerae bacterium]
MPDECPEKECSGEKDPDGSCHLIITVSRNNNGTNSTLGTFEAREKCDDNPAVEGHTLEPKKGRYNLGNGLKNYPIPAGTYGGVRKRSPNHGQVVGIKTPGTGFGDILIHKGNYPSDTEGCVLVGNSQPRPDFISNSADAMGKLLKYIDKVKKRCGNKFKMSVKIEDAPTSK